MKYRIIRADRAAKGCKVGEIVHSGADCYGVASDDTRETGLEHIAVSYNESGIPFFTIPRHDIERA